MVLNIAYLITQFPKTHETFISENLLETISNKLSEFIQKPHSDIANSDISELVFYFQVLTSFSLNPICNSEMISLNIIERMNFLFQKYNEIYFLSELFLNTLKKMCQTYEGVLLLQRFKINFEELCTFSLASFNTGIIKTTKYVISRLISEEQILKAVDSVKKKVNLYNNLCLLCFVGKNIQGTEYFNHKEIIDVCVEWIVEPTLTVPQKFAVVKMVDLVISNHTNQALYLEEINGIDIILSIVYSEEGLIIWSSMMKLVVHSIRQLPADFVQTQLKKNYYRAFIQKFESLPIMLENFVKNALTTEKALISISYNQGEVAKYILRTLKNTKEVEVVSTPLALNYLSTEKFTCNFFSLMAQLKAKKLEMTFDLNEKMLGCMFWLMKIFKNSYHLYERIFGLLSQCQFSVQLTKFITNNQWPVYLCDLIWKKPSWKIVSLNILRFIEAIMSDKQNIKILQMNSSSIRLIATIKNFIIEEDSSIFEEIDEEPNDQNEDSFGEKLGTLNYAEEREIYRKATFLIENLIDASSLQTFKSNIERDVKIFKPKPETIQILRAEYALLASVNSINFFGIEGLKANLHIALREYINIIENSVNQSHFHDKEKLLGDAIRSITNFICITWSENGSKQYFNSECSAIVFKLLEKYLKESNQAIYTYTILKVFKEWLVNRLEIIENYDDNQKAKVYSSDHFMMISEGKVEEIMTNILDSLYQTYQKFYKYEKLTLLNMEVINLLCHISHLWRKRVGITFIPQIFDVLSSDVYSIESDFKAIELLKVFTGTDEKSEEPHMFAINSALISNGLTKIFKTISQNGFNSDYTSACRPLIEGMIVQDTENNAASTKNLIEELDKQIAEFIELGNDRLLTEQNLTGLSTVIGEMNHFSLIDGLKDYLREKGYLPKIGMIWQFVNANIEKTSDMQIIALLEKLDKLCGIAVINYSENSLVDLKLIFGDPEFLDITEKSQDLLVNCFKSFMRNGSNEEMIWLCSKIINSCFPSSHSDLCLKIHKGLNNDEVLNKIHKSFANHENKQFVQELNDLYMNLSKSPNEHFIEKLIKTLLKTYKNSLIEKNCLSLSETMKSIAPFLNNPLFENKIDFFPLDVRFLDALKVLKESVLQKTSKNGNQIAENALSSMTVPDLTLNEKNTLKEEILMAKSIVDFMKHLPQKTQNELLNNPEFCELINLPLVLNGEIDGLAIVEKMTTDNVFAEQAKHSKLFETITYILLRKNKDSFKPFIGVESDDLEKSTITSLKRSTINALTHSFLLARPKANTDLLASTIPENTLPVKSEIFNQQFSERFAQNFALYTKIVSKIVTDEKVDDIINKYLSSLNDYKNNSNAALFSCIVASRETISILQVKDKHFNIEKHSPALLSAYIGFYKKLRTCKPLNKKLMRLTENILNKFCKKCKNEEIPIRNAKIWNILINHYLVLNPDAVSSNHKKIFKNLILTKPIIANKEYILHLLDLSNGRFKFEFDFASINILSGKNQKSISEIFKNLKIISEKSPVLTDSMFGVLEGIMRSKTATKELIQNPFFLNFISLINSFDDFDNKKAFENMSHVLTNCMGVGQEQEQLRQIINQKVHSDNYSKKYFQVIDEFKKPLFNITVKTLMHIFLIVDNTSGFFDQKIPEKVLEILGEHEDWQPKNTHYFSLFAVMIKNDSFENMLCDLNFPEQVDKFLHFHAIQNETPVFKLADAGKDAILMSKEKSILLLEIMAYIKGEFSKYSHTSSNSSRSIQTTVTFEIFASVEKLSADIAIALKLIEFVRNSVLNFEDSDLIKYASEIPIMEKKADFLQIKFIGTKLIADYLQEILTFLKKRSIVLNDQRLSITDESKLERKKTVIELQALKSLVEVSSPRDNLNITISDLAELFQSLNDTLEIRPLTMIEDKKLGLGYEKVQAAFSNPGNAEIFTLFSLNIPTQLRLLANQENLGMFSRNEAMATLNNFLRVDDLKQKMLLNDFFVQKSIANIIALLPEEQIAFNTTELELCDLIHKDLCFLEKLVVFPNGAEIAINFAFEGKKIQPVLLDFIETTFGEKQVKIKGKALKVLICIVKFCSFEETENRLFKNQSILFSENIEHREIEASLFELFAIIAHWSKNNKLALVKSGILESAKYTTDIHQKYDNLNKQISHLLLELATDCPENHQKILLSSILPFIASAFNNAIGEKGMYENVSKMILQISYQDNEKKLKLLDIGFAAGLITLFVLYSSDTLYDQDICIDLLKCMANFSTMPLGAETLLKDKIIISFRNYFDNFKETMPQQIKFIMLTMSNMAYMPKQLNLDMIVEDKGIDLILDGISFAEEKHDEELIEACFDALTQMISDTKAIEQLKTSNAVDKVVDTIRQQTNDLLIYKGLMCLNQMTKYEYFAKKILDKGGHAVAAEIIRLHPNDLKNVLQSLKLIKNMIDTFPDKHNIFLQAGIPEKILHVFSEQWPFFNKN